MPVKSLIYAIWIGGMGLQIVLAAILLLKRTWRSFPIFTVYCCVSCSETMVLYFLRLTKTEYFFTYWLYESLGIFLGFAVLYEVFRTLFRGHPALARLASSIFRWTVATLAFFGFVVFYVNSSTLGRGLMTQIMVLEEATRVMEVGLLLTLFVLSAAFGLHWRQHVFGIAVGLGLFTAVELASLATTMQPGMAATPTFAAVRGTAFDLSLLIWIGYMLAPERVTSAELPKTAQLEQWNQAMMELIHQ